MPLIIAITCFSVALGAVNRPGRAYRSADLGADVGEPLLLSPYIESGSIAEGRTASEVHIEGLQQPSHSGFMTVDKVAGSNLFFWLFHAQNRTGAEPPPLVLWLQGGPGASGLFGLFAEIGPYAVDATSSSLIPRDVHWNRGASLLFVDSPVGSGFSFTSDYHFFARNETQIAEGLLSMLRQTLILFPEYQSSEFFIFGESYGGGKYAPALASMISRFNSRDQSFASNDLLKRINLKGVGLGDPGVADPVAQFPVYADELYNMGLVDMKQREQVRAIMQQAVNLTLAGEYAKAFALWNSVWGDIGDEKFPSLFNNLTFSTYTENLAFSSPPKEFDFYVDWINLPAVRRAIHVGSLPYGGNSSKVYNTLAYDAGEFCGETLTNAMVQLVQEFRFIVYAGAFDPLLGPALSEAWLTKIFRLIGPQAAAAFAKIPRTAWRVNAEDSEVAGYAREAGKLTFLVVRNAGHIVPHDQPRSALDIMERMVHGRSFGQSQNLTPFIV